MKSWPSLDQWLQSKTALWVISFALAIGLWIFVVGDREQSVIKDFDVRLEFLNAPAGLTVSPSTRQATVTVQGERSALTSLENGRLVGEIDLKGQKEGLVRLPVRIDGADRVDVLQISPSVVDVELVHMTEVALPLRLQLPKNAPRGYGLQDATIEPEQVTLRARAADLEGVEYLTLEPTLDQLEGSLPLLISPTLPEKLAQVEPEVQPAKVRLSGQWGEGLPQSDVPLQANLVGALPPGLSLANVEVSPTTVRVEASAQRLKESKIAVTTEAVDLSKIHETTTLKVKVVPPQDVKVITPQEVEVTVDVMAPADEKLYEALPVKLKNATGSWTVEPKTVDVRVRFSEVEKNVLTASQLNLVPYVDMDNVVSSPLRLPVRVQLPKGVSAVTLEPTTVKVSKGEE